MLIGFAEELVMVITARDPAEKEQRTEMMARLVKSWLYSVRRKLFEEISLNISKISN